MTDPHHHSPLSKAESDILKSIKQQLLRLADGVTAEQLRKAGEAYHLSMGLPLPLLAQLATQYTPGTPLSDALALSSMREQQLLSIYLRPAEALTAGWILTLVKHCATLECQLVAARKLGELPESCFERETQALLLTTEGHEGLRIVIEAHTRRLILGLGLPLTSLRLLLKQLSRQPLSPAVANFLPRLAEQGGYEKEIGTLLSEWKRSQPEVYNVAKQLLDL